MKQLFKQLQQAEAVIVAAHAARRRILNELAAASCKLEVGAYYRYLDAPHSNRILRCDEINAVGGWRSDDCKKVEWIAMMTILKKDGTPMLAHGHLKRIAINQYNRRTVRKVRCPGT